MTSDRLRDRTAIVTGASQGIGREIALEFAREGATVVVADVKEDPYDGADPTTVELIRDEVGAEAVYHETDVTAGDDVAATVAATVDRFGGLDVLVNNAGIFPYEITSQTIEEIDEAHWDAVMAVNLKGIFHCCKHALPHLKASDAGRIVNLSSKMGLVGHHGGAPYAASKGGVVALTKQLAVDYGDDAICVNAIAPGTIITGTKTYRLDEEGDHRREGTLLPYLGEGRDVSRAAVYLASDDGRFVTGQTLVVEGGWTAH